MGQYLTDDTVRINNEQSSEGNSLLLNQDSVVLCQLVVLVAKQGEPDTTETTLLARGPGPS